MIRSPLILNVKVCDFRGDGGRISWDDGEARYHVWVNLSTKEVRADVTRQKNPTIYKNSLVSDRRQPGYFTTRFLDATSKGNAEIIARLWKHIEVDDLIAKGRAAERAETEAADRKRLAESIEFSKKRLVETIKWLAERDHDGLLEVLSNELSLADLDAIKARFP